VEVSTELEQDPPSATKRRYAAREQSFGYQVEREQEAHN
jgi:hypothetical protein